MGTVSLHKRPKFSDKTQGVFSELEVGSLGLGP